MPKESAYPFPQGSLLPALSELLLLLWNFIATTSHPSLGLPSLLFSREQDMTRQHPASGPCH